MHTTKLRYQDNKEWKDAIINHNGDWSGDAFIKWDIVEVDGRPQAQVTTRVPGRILKALVQHSNECAIEYLQDAIRQLGKQT